ncbi:hypothetical protein E2C01_063243 [Portunus trituberculatus]|uniref:Uncharacterized protein n=1 Tax=Portunus trituberculatus TaxID=210409 RepID=A0A5B7H9Y9_PORTR|nr:hypothetical protein [Portunus trituberculatus]
MKQTPGPVLSNMVVDCSPTDNVVCHPTTTTTTTTTTRYFFYYTP